MKRLLSVSLLMFCLCVPSFAGHTASGGWCDCGAPGCTCDPGEHPLSNKAVAPKKSDRDRPVDLGAETLLVLGVLLLALRYKA